MLDEDAFFHSGTVWQQLRSDINEVDRCYRYERMQSEGYSLSFYQQEELRNAPSFYGSSQDSNFLWVIVDDNRQVLKTNLDSEDPCMSWSRRQTVR